MNASPLLAVSDLSVSFHEGDAIVGALEGLSYEVSRDETVALVGASGAGKSVGGRAVFRLLPAHARVTGSVHLDGRALFGLDDRAMRECRRTEMAMVRQDPSRALDPTMRIGAQLAGASRLREGASRRAARLRALELLELVGVPGRFDAYPHELSGGMRQRVAIGLALTGKPKLLFADEPTSALDVRTQAQIMDLLAELRERFAMAMVIVSHDAEIVAGYADRIVTVGTLRGPAPDREVEPAEPLRPTSGFASARGILLEARHLVREFPARGTREPVRRVLSDVSLSIRTGETLSVVGASGAGKSTLARALMQAPRPTRGEVLLRGVELGGLRPSPLREARREMQMIFQDASSSMDPTWNVARIVGEPLRAYATRGNRSDRVAELLELVGLDTTHHAGRRRHELSGGELQRVALARALAPSPSLLICDEPLSALDATARRELATLLERLRDELGLAFLLIAHDLGLVRRLSDRIAVMRDGSVCEIGPAASVADRPWHPYAAELFAPRRRHGTAYHRERASPVGGCGFRAFCSRATPRCAVEVPRLRAVAPGHAVACHDYDTKR